MEFNQDYIVKKFAGETMLVHQNENVVDFSKVITLNEVAEFIIEKIKDGKDETEIVKDLLSEYEVSEEKASADVHAFIEKLKSLNIVYE